MKHLFLSILLLPGSQLFATEIPERENVALLTLADESRVDISLTGAIGNSNTSATVSGTVSALLDLNPQDGRTFEFSLLNSALTIGSFSLSSSTPFSRYQVSSTPLQVLAETPDRPGQTTPAAEEGTTTFQTSQHQLTVNGGSINGSIRTFGLSRDLFFDYAEENFSSSAEGEGTVKVTLSEERATLRLYEVEVTLPINLTQTISEQGLPLSTDVTLTGTLIARGHLFLQNSTRTTAYNQWADSAGLLTERPDHYTLSPQMTNAALFALGHPAERPAGPLFRVSSDGNYTIEAGAEGTRLPLILLASPDLQNPVSTLIPSGSTGLLTAPSPGSRGFFQIALP